jgi:Tfp pilus assembly protein PilF
MTGFWRTHPWQIAAKQWKVWGGLIGLLATAALARADVAGAQRNFLDGDYADVIKEATAGVRDTPANIEWPILLIRALLTVGRNGDADVAMREALGREEQSIRLRWLAREVAQANGRPEEAAQRVEEIRRLVAGRTWNYRTPPELVVFGRAAVMLGADPKDVLEKVFGTAQKSDPKLRDVYLARGELALEKHDFQLAARAFEEGLKQLPDDPDLHSGRARAYAGGDRTVAAASLAAALKRNPRHVPTLLQIADHHIDAEAYEEADKILDQIIVVNPGHPEAWAYRAVLAHLRNDQAGENVARGRALSTWRRNPRVDHLIGAKLSQKYRFAEGAAYQRRARAFDPNYLPAASQLASDLLRLGNEAEGWALAREVHEKDDYDVEAYNLVTLHDTMSKYVALASEDFVVRMHSKEVTVYGPRVLSLLRRAKQSMVEKYGVELAKPTYIEIFADQRDFAVRTFGLPDVAGFLGVCFGRVVTANSPASSSSPTNWESVLWHEFCHVITLQMTRNKMPRWLSEGISVYEEKLADPSWGMQLNPRYRQMIVDGELVPVGKLSAAFLGPKTSNHLQFAYLQSSMVVDFIVRRFGQPALRGILTDLREGMEINAALAKNTVPLEQLEKDFEVFAQERAQELAPKLDWEKPDPELLVATAAEDLAAWEKKHPDNYYLLRLRAQRAADEQKWTEAKTALERLVELYPRQKGTEAPHRPLVAALRALGDTAGERKALQRWVQVDDEAPDAYLRLMELAAADKDWATVSRNAERYLAVNPLVASPYRYQAQATAETGDVSSAVVAWRTLLQLDVPDAPEAHFKLAGLLHGRGENAEAHRHILTALEETPRYREALRLLVDIKRSATEPPARATTPEPVTVPAPPAPKKQ